jgi:aminopeptidase N
MDTPVPDTMFGVGNFRRYVKPFKGEETSIPFDYYWIENPTGTSRAPNNDFIAAEMSNSIQYYGLQFGIYPFGSLHGIYTCQQTGLPSPITNNSSAIPRTSATMLLLPGRSVDFAFAYGFNARRLAFISEGIGRQWWGNAVDLRSYRDDWLREGLPFYFSLLYTGQRDSLHSLVDMIDTMHAGLRAPPTTLQGIGSGRIADVGSIIGGRRLDTIDTTNAYSQLVVGKGALVIRMLHFLFTDPGTRDDKAFFAMMQDFFMRYSGKAASTEDFLAVANEHFVDTPIAKKFALADLGWFFRQWVYTTHLPTYRLLYHLESNPDGSAVLKGKLYQEDVPADEKWFMPIPLVMTYGKDKEARGVIAVLGGEQDVTVDVPQMPDKVELDPELFVLSAKSIAQKDH